jgi:hypothetical protein
MIKKSNEFKVKIEIDVCEKIEEFLCINWGQQHARLNVMIFPAPDKP